jgi:hypothetical protein
MKTNKKYLLLSFLTILTVSGASIGALSFAQTSPVLGCSMATATVITNQAEVLTATGGNGVYAWSGPNLSVANSAGSQFAVSYPVPGSYPITVTSANQVATCNVVVVAASGTSMLSCFPVTQNVTLGQTATVTATGGDGNYTWAAPDLNITNANGAGFSANYASTGVKTLTVTSAGLVTTCTINVVLGNATPTPPVTPGLPNTGGGFGH